MTYKKSSSYIKLIKYRGKKEVKKMMYGIYKKSAGLQFTGVVAKTEEDAKRYLGNKYGSIEDVCLGYNKVNKEFVYGKRFVPWYREDLFEIIELEVVE